MTRKPKARAGEAAFQRILAWKSGTFENLPAEPDRERTILKPVNALLLESAQAMDETADSVEPESIEQTAHRKTIWKLALLTREGAEFVIVVPAEGQGEVETMGMQPSEPLDQMGAPRRRNRQTTGRTDRGRPAFPHCRP